MYYLVLRSHWQTDKYILALGYFASDRPKRLLAATRSDNKLQLYLINFVRVTRNEAKIVNVVVMVVVATSDVDRILIAFASRIVRCVTKIAESE